MYVLTVIRPKNLAWHFPLSTPSQELHKYNVHSSGAAGALRRRRGRGPRPQNHPRLSPTHCVHPPPFPLDTPGP